MTDLVNSEEEVLVRRCADYVGCEEEGPGEWRCVAERVGAGDLESDDGEDEVFGQRFGAA